jgi:molybdopterin/thiamine biosynthesis adenylyltransferase
MIMPSELYRMLSNRNIGLLSEEQQLRLKDSCVAVCGLGGLGGAVAEILARTGIGAFKLMDCGTFEPTNLNRQIYCFTDTNDRLKTDVTEEYLHKINPDIRIEKHQEVTENNVQTLLSGVDVVALCVDALIPILLLSRVSRQKRIPLVESWAVAYGNVRVFNENTPSLEEVYGFPTIGREVSSITPEEEQGLILQSIASMMALAGLKKDYPDSAIHRMMEKGEATTLAPMVWLSCVMVACEIIKILLNWGNLALAPHFAVYDCVHHRIPPQNSL